MRKIMGEIEHVVLLMLENRSFDNVVGWLYSDNDQPNHLIHSSVNSEPATYDGLGNGKKYSNELKGKSYFIKDATLNDKLFGMPNPDPHEEYEYVNKQLFNQKKEPAFGTAANMKGFLEDYYGHGIMNNPQHAADQIMVAYTPKELSVLNGLSKNYAISDRWFSSVPTQTTPNRAFMACGTSLGAEINSDCSKYQHKTIWNVLAENNKLNWGIYYHQNTLPYYLGKCYTHYTFPYLDNIPNINEHFCNMETFYKKAAAGTLPAFSFLEPSWVAISGGMGNDYHPPANLRPGEEFINKLYKSLISNKEAWKKTLFIITFDEHGGTWDHVSPPWGSIPPDNSVGPTGFKFNRFGVRIPTLLISPWINEKTVFRSEKIDSNGKEIPYDHTSLIATILKWSILDINLEKCGLGKRVVAAPTFESIINRSSPRQDIPQLKFYAPALDEEVHLNADLNGFQKEIFLPILAHNLKNENSNVEDEQVILEDIRAKCKTQLDLDSYVKDFVAKNPISQTSSGYKVKISVKNQTRSRIWYWLAWGSIVKTPVGNPLGNSIETGETITAFENIDELNHQYYIAVAYWVGNNNKIPSKFQITQKPQWQLIGKENPGWMEIGHKQELVIKQQQGSTIEISKEQEVETFQFGYNVEIKVHNNTPSEITYWLAWGTKIKTDITPLIGVTVQRGETITAFNNKDITDHQYYIAVAYWVGNKSKIPKDYRCNTPGWRLIGEKYPGWITIGHQQTYTINQSGPPFAKIIGELGPCE